MHSNIVLLVPSKAAERWHECSCVFLAHVNLLSVRNQTIDKLQFSKSLVKIFMCNGLQAAKEVEASPMQDKSNVDFSKPVKAAKRRKAVG